MEMTILQTMVGGFGVTAFLHLFYWTKYQDTPKGRMEKEEKTRKEAHLEQIRKEAYADELGRREAQRNRSHVITEREFETSNSFQNDFNAFLSPVDKSDKEIWFGKKRVRDSIFDKSEFSTSNSRKKKKRKFDDMF